MNPPRASELGLVACHTCGNVADAAVLLVRHASCSRCGTKIHYRHPDSINRTSALLIAGVVFYIPANVLPVMYTSVIGGGHESTILGGVIQFWSGGSYGIALLIFIASVAVPCSKFLIMTLLLVTSRRRSGWAQVQRAKLYRLVEMVGYWSMLDVLVVAIIAALVKFQALSDVEPRLGIFFFGLVVILTMLSAMNFDPRLIWDGEDK